LQTSKQEQQVAVNVTDLASSDMADPIRVLHVDDDARILSVSKAILMMKGNFEIDDVPCVDEAFKKLETQTYDAVISDYEMPQKDGLQFLKELRKKKNSIPFVLFTGKGREEVAIKALNLGADGYYSKHGAPETVYGELAHGIRMAVARKAAETALIKAETLTNSIFDGTQDMIWTISADDYRLLTFNQSLRDYFFRTQKLCIKAGMRLEELMPTRDLVLKWYELNRRALREGSFTTEYTTLKDPRVLELTFNVLKHGETVFGISVFGKDITERKKAAEILAASEAKYRELIDCLPEIVFEIDTKANVIFTNEKAFEKTGYSREDMAKGFNAFSLLAPEDSDKATEQLKKIFTGDIGHVNEYTFVRKDGTRFPVSLSISPIIENGKVVGARGIAVDIAERKRVEEELAKQNALTKGILESVNEGVFSVDSNYRHTSFNKRHVEVMKSLWGIDIEIGGNLLDYLTNSSDKKAAKANIDRALNGEFVVDERESGDEKFARRYLELRHCPVRNQKGEITGVAIFSKDTTERKKAQEAIKQSEAKMRSVIENSGDQIFMVDKNFKYLIVNKMLGDVLGRPFEKIIGKSISEVYPESGPGFIKNVEKVFSSGTRLVIDERMVVKNKEYINSASLNPVKADDGNVIAVTGIVRDITERKQTEERIRKSEEQLKAVVSNAPIGIATSDSNKYFLSANESFCKILGFSEDELRKLTFKDVTYAEDMEESITNMEKLVSGCISFFSQEKRYIRKDGAIIDGKITVNAIRDEKGKPTVFVAELEDITESKKAEQLLREQEQCYHALFDQAPIGVLIVDPETAAFVEFNKVAHEQLGYTRDEFATVTVPKIEAKETVEDVKSHIAQMLAKGGGEFETKHRTKDGEIRNVLVSTQVIELSGKIVLHCIFHDITDIRNAQDALMKSETQYRQLVELAQEGVWALDKDYNTTFVNPRMMQMLGYEKNEMIGKNIFEFLRQEDVNPAKHELAKYPGGVHQNFEYEFTRKDGSRIYTSIASSKITDDQGNYVGNLALVADITLRKHMADELAKYSKDLEELVDQRTKQLAEAQAQLVKSERLAAIGELAGMVGHDLRNPLSGIKNATYFLENKSSLISETQRMDMLVVINRCIDHSNKIINDLLDYSREIHLDLKESQPSKLIFDALAMANVPERVKIVSNLPEEQHLKVDPDKIERVFINLMKNAVDAMPNGGIITIDSVEASGNLKISIADTGTGIPEDLFPKLFSPLVTTKAQGMGFGLAICKRIIEAHGGTITVTSAKGKGATFTLSLPIMPESSSLKTTKPTIRSSLKTILENR